MHAEKYAGFWLRFIAAFADIIILLAVSFLLLLIAGSSIIGLLGLSAEQSESLGYVYGYAFPFAFVVLQWFYSSILESTKRRATVGKMIVKIKVCDTEGRKLTLLLSAARNAFKMLSLLMLFVGFVTIFFTQRKQALHDLICGCLVIRQTPI